MMTPLQIDTLKALVLADQVSAALAAAADDIGLAAWLNTPEPTFIVWREDVTPGECHDVMVWTEIDGVTVGKARIWEWMRSIPVLDYRKTNIRQGLNDAFTGLATRTAVVNIGKRPATRAEKALATGAGTNTTPAMTTFIGAVSFADASQIRS